MAKKTKTKKKKRIAKATKGQVYSMSAGDASPTAVTPSVSKVTPRDLDELGTSGLKRTGQIGLVNEEFLPALQAEKGRRTLREMRDNDPIIGAFLYAIEMLLRNVTWRVEGEDEEAVQFIEECRQDMSHTWEDLIAEILSMLVFGYSWHEIVLKRRLGPSNDPKRRSRFTDGRFGWRKVPIRAQESFAEWEFDEEGGVHAFVQVAEPKFERIVIPIERSLLFRVGMHKGNPEGRSLLRNAYRPWFLKHHIENIEAIGVERDLAGLPVIWRTGRVKEAYEDDLKKILRNVRRDEQEGVILPLVYDDENRKELEFELLSTAGRRQFDTTKIIDRYDKRILMTVMADFMMLGQTQHGSFALSSDKTTLFATGLGAILKAIAAVFNRHAIPRLLEVNVMRVKKPPELIPGDVESPNLQELGQYVKDLAGSGMPLFPDEELEEHLRASAGFPARPEEMLEPSLPEEESEEEEEDDEEIDDEFDDEDE